MYQELSMMETIAVAGNCCIVVTLVVGMLLFITMNIRFKEDR